MGLGERGRGVVGTTDSDAAGPAATILGLCAMLGDGDATGIAGTAGSGPGAVFTGLAPAGCTIGLPGPGLAPGSGDPEP